jgi:nucleotide-binding universal stress UspA family protein
MLRIKRILVPTDSTPEASSAYSYALSLAQRFGAEIHLLHVFPPEEGKRGAPPRDLLALTFAEDPGGLEKSRGVLTIQAEIADKSPPTAIVTYARVYRIDLIVMGGRGNEGLHQHHLGGVAGPVVRYAPCSVLTVRERLPQHGIRRILVPVDLSGRSRTPLIVARYLARAFDSEIDLLLVLEHSIYTPSSGNPGLPRLETERQQAWEEKLNEFWKTNDGPDVPHEIYVRIGSTGPEIINFALQRATDLIAIGTHGKTGLRRIVMGSVAEQIVYRALCATLTVKSFGRPLLCPGSEDLDARPAPDWRPGKGVIPASSSFPDPRLRPSTTE